MTQNVIGEMVKVAAGAGAAANPYAAVLTALPYIAQAGMGLYQVARGQRKRQDIDTSVNKIYEENVQTAKNLSQSTSQAFDMARRGLASQYASNLQAAQRGATGAGSLLRQQQLAARSAQEGGARLYMGELQAQRSDFENLQRAKMTLASAQERSQALKNQIAMQENQALDQMQAAGATNVFGAGQGYATYNIAKMQADAMRQSAGLWGRNALGFNIG